jgi:hypothetical protein
MNITYSNGESVTKPYNKEEFEAAMADPEVVKASVYKVGSIVTMSDRKYRVGQAGNLVRIREGADHADGGELVDQ